MRRVVERVKPYLFIEPHYALFLVFFVVPAVAAIYISFTRWDFIGRPVFVGLANYRQILTDKGGYYFDQFWSAFLNTFRYVVISVPLLIGVPLLLAVAIHPLKRLGSFFQSVFYFPYLLSVATVVLTWRWLLDRSFGLVNHVLGADIGWTVDQPFFWIAIVVMSVWWGLGGNMVIYLAGMADISQDLYEAAELDGANQVNKFIHITLPGLKNQLLYTTVMTSIASFNIFGQPVMLANAKNLSSDKNVLIALVQGTAFGTSQIAGMASAIAVVLGVVIVIVSIFQFRFSK
jgi:multiple sugar transport system permease protein